MNAQWRCGDATSGPAPLVVLFHGRGADEHDLLDFADLACHAERSRSIATIVAVPRLRSG
jgi:predicted esterase